MLPADVLTRRLEHSTLAINSLEQTGLLVTVHAAEACPWAATYYRINPYRYLLTLSPLQMTV